MGTIVITEFVSLDGVVEDPGGIGDFKHAGWTFQIERGGEERRGLGQADPEQLLHRVPIAVAEYKLRETLGTEALLLGRITYEEFAALWPPRDGEFADKFNSLPKYVVSSTLEDPDWSNSTVLGGDVVEEVSSLKRALGGDIVVHGSIRLARTLIEHDLVDELRLMVYPIVLGSGERLFGELSDKKPLRLVDTRMIGDGVVLHSYEPLRDPAGSSAGERSAAAGAADHR
jgi:dihydrofolate reductase